MAEEKWEQNLADEERWYLKKKEKKTKTIEKQGKQNSNKQEENGSNMYNGSNIFNTLGK